MIRQQIYTLMDQLRFVLNNSNYAKIKQTSLADAISNVTEGCFNNIDTIMYNIYCSVEKQMFSS